VWVFHDVPSRDWFERCIDEICAAREVVPLDELALHSRRGACAITFDDGLRSVAEVAHPVLSAAGLPYTVFVCTDVLIGGPVPWFVRVSNLIERIGLSTVHQEWELTAPTYAREWELMAALKEVPFDELLEGIAALEERYSISPPDPVKLFVTASEVLSIAASGGEIASHTHRHPILSLLSEAEQQAEILESVLVIEGLTGRRPESLAYPNGTPADFDGVTTAALRRSGIRRAATTLQRFLRAHDDRLALPRIGLNDGEPSVHQALRSLAPFLSRSLAREESIRSEVRGRLARPLRPVDDAEVGDEVGG
jgi:peptidoglycan/xylan/chitin deacetylase (PgdA/CDA1 family)